MENYYIVRCDNAGVFAGNIKERDGREVTMTNVRRLWSWSGATETLQLAAEGVKNPDNCRFTTVISEMTVLDANTIIACTPEAEECIKAVPVWAM